MSPYEQAVSNDPEKTNHQFILEFTENATKDTACARIECVLHPKSTAPSTAVQHVRDTVTAALPWDREIMDSLSNQRLMETLHPLMNQQMLKLLLHHEDLQELLKVGEPFSKLDL
jgi:hypothetical protein